MQRLDRSVQVRQVLGLGCLAFGEHEDPAFGGAAVGRRVPSTVLAARP